MNKVGAVLVVGAGIGGSQASLDLAESGYKVYLVESSMSIGGVMAQLDKTFPTNDCAMCIVSPKLVETGRHNNIKLIINTEIKEFKGEPGNFKVKLLKKALYINQDKCTGCGVCASRCPIEAIDTFNEGLSICKATSVKYPQAVPLVFSINLEKCIGCGVCEGVCKAGAVEYDQEDTEIEINVGAVILAPGFDEFEPESIKEYGYGKYKNVVTSIEFERILSASGPFGGKILRLSDGDIPKKIAFLQCVGSRDMKRGKPYCSSVCCMYTAKEAVIANEHFKIINPTIFYMDIRAYGKDFDKYIERAKEEYGVRYVKNRIASINEDPETKNLLINYETDDGKIIVENFNMLVLAVGLNHPKDAEKLSDMFDVDLNEFKFAKTGSFTPIETSRSGVFVCGAFQGPKDIPETVTQASAAAGAVDVLLSDVKNTLVTKKELPEEIDVRGQPPRIGVFICHCGINIGAYVDVPAVTEYAATLPNVALAERNLYTCSADTQTNIKEKIKEYNLNRVIVASCTPRTHEPLFQETIREAGLNRYLFQMTNIRDQCSWVHMHEPEKATEKAKDLVRMAVNKARKIFPLERITLELTKKVLVIGGGITGMNAALDFARQGYETALVEKEKQLGGIARKVYATLEGGNVQQYLNDLIQKVKSQNNLHVYTQVDIQAIDGYVGNFQSIFTHSEDREEEIFDHGVVIVATGAHEYKPTEFEYGKDSRIIRQLELEEKLYKHVDEIKNLKSIVMIQCVGSRNQEHPYCSKICCAEAIKNALKIKEINPHINITILYRDIRTYGFKEIYYREARQEGVLFIEFDEKKPPEVKAEDGFLNITVNKRDVGKIKIKADLLILSTGIVADREENESLAMKLKVPINDDNFFLEAHVKLRPVDFATEGVFVAGLAHSPKPIEDCIAQAKATVSRACTILSKEYIEAEGKIALVDPWRCSGCGLCVLNCAYNAVELQEVRHFGTIAVVNEALCKGCGACSGNCRNSAIDVLGFSGEQIYAMIMGRD